MKEQNRGARLQVKRGNAPAQSAGIFVFLLAALLTGCAARQPIPIGFTAELSGRNSTLGVQSRNGAQLAVEAINARGGVAGRPLELVVRDNLGSPEQVALEDQKILDSGAFVLTGHNTSWEAMAAKPVIDAREAILFSPSAATPMLTSRDDSFFRLIPVNIEQAWPLAEYAYQEQNLRRIATLDDEDNLSFVHPLVEGFVERFEALGGEKVLDLHFSSREHPDFHSIAEKLRESSADGLLVVASDADTALIAQHVRMVNWDVQIFASNWAYTGGLIQNGGRAVEGLILPSHFNTSCEGTAYQQFRATFRSRYGYEPGFISALSYETIQVIAQALEVTGGKWEGFTQALNNIKDFDGLCGKISLDANGDAVRNLFLFQIQNSQFKIIKTLPPKDAP